MFIFQRLFFEHFCIEENTYRIIDVVPNLVSKEHLEVLEIPIDLGVCGIALHKGFFNKMIRILRKHDFKWFLDKKLEL
ncbi:MAG: hypothetical protein FWF57_05480 [Defluviitaleaceae bacterium]|nr:hypothetical protein [Defluviitaleaceae bacterium]